LRQAGAGMIGGRNVRSVFVQPALELAEVRAGAEVGEGDALREGGRADEQQREGS